MALRSSTLVQLLKAEGPGTSQAGLLNAPSFLLSGWVWILACGTSTWPALLWASPGLLSSCPLFYGRPPVPVVAQRLEAVGGLSTRPLLSCRLGSPWGKILVAWLGAEEHGGGAFWLSSLATICGLDWFHGAPEQIVSRAPFFKEVGWG